MSGLGKKSKILAKIKHFFKCVKWSKQRITRGYCDCDVWEKTIPMKMEFL